MARERDRDLSKLMEVISDHVFHILLARSDSQVLPSWGLGVVLGVHSRG